ncbi:MAG: hypothetical protein JWM14_1450 [Chitinophagaceae bacterium]|nr:hypothetical protein [Chitinophagaceae bacterium]
MEVYKIDIKHQLLSIRPCINLLLFQLVIGIILYFLMEEKTVLVIAILFGIFNFIIVSPLQINYFMLNHATQLTVDRLNKTFTLQQDGHNYHYDFTDVTTERLVSAEVKIKYTNNPFNGYGGVKIMTNDGKIFYISSLMADPFDFPLPIKFDKKGLPWFPKHKL